MANQGENGTSCPEMLLLEWNSRWDEVQTEENVWSHCTNCWGVLRAPENTSAVAGDSTSQQGERSTGQAGDRLTEKLLYAAQSAQSQLKGALLQNYLEKISQIGTNSHCENSEMPLWS